MPRRTSSFLVALGFFVFLVGPVDARFAAAQNQTPEQVLRSAGLMLKGRCYVVREEIQAESLAQKMTKLSMEVAAGMRTAMVLESDMIGDGLMSGELGEAMAFAQMESRGRSRRGRGRSSQSRGIRNQENAVRRDAQRDHTQLNRIASRMTADERQYQTELIQFRTLVGAMMTRYDALSRRSEIQKSLRILNQGVHPKYALGPIPAYRARIDSEMARILAEKGLRAHKSSIESIEEKSLLKRADAANSLALHLDRSKAPADDPRRAQLAAEVGALRKLAESLDQKREDLSRDPDVVDAVEELNVPKNRRRFRVGLSLDAESSRHILKRLAGGK